ncbi:hypothetical protein FACS1894200_03600 [Spirochaetia bacterium]|nr:hypothetical protein FACS1894200_03600 [Spirochaetia bacterium]
MDSGFVEVCGRAVNSNGRQSSSNELKFKALAKNNKINILLKLYFVSNQLAISNMNGETIAGLIQKSL